MARLTITLLGDFAARIGPGPRLGLRTRKAQALLAYLALPAGQTHSRDKLAALLWGDEPPMRGRARLRETIFALRKALAQGGRRWLQTGGDGLALSSDGVDVDVAEFERLVRDGSPTALGAAAPLYRGDLLHGFAGQSPDFEGWLLTERERLREVAVAGFGKLLAHERAAGHLDAALQTALRLAALDPLQEPVHRTLMRLYAGLGRRGAALRQYQTCVDVLERELGTEPEPATKQLYQDLLQRRPTTPRSERRADGVGVEAPRDPLPSHYMRRVPTVSTDIPLVGREDEMARLAAALDAARRGGGRVIVVQGEAGVGKSRLIAELANEAARVDCRILLGRCYEAEQILPFGPWVDALRIGNITEATEGLRSLLPRYRTELVRLLPELGSGLTDGSAALPDHLKLFEAVTELLRLTAAQQPVVLLLEDLHWADDMTLRLLTFLGHRLPGWPLLVVATARDEELMDLPPLRRALAELDREAHVTRLRLSPLSRAATADLVRLLAQRGRDGSDLAQVGEAIWRASEGNPFVVVEAMRALDEGVVSTGSVTLSLPERVREMIGRRLDRLGDSAQRLVAVAAVIGREFEFSLLQHAADLDEGKAAEGTEELVRRHLLRAAGDRFDFIHDRIREVAYGRLLSPRRKLLHRQVAEAIEAIYGGELERHHLALGHHYRESEVWDRATTYLGQAGVGAVARLASREAAASFEQAMAALGHLPETRGTIEQAIDLRLYLRAALLPLGQNDRMIEVLEEAEALAGKLEDQGTVGRLSVHRSLCLSWAGHADRAEAPAARALDIAVRLGDAYLEPLAEYCLGVVYMARGQYRLAAEMFERIIALVGPGQVTKHVDGPGAPRADSRARLALSLGHLGDLTAARAMGEEAAQVAESANNPWSRVMGCSALGEVHLAQGNLLEAETWLERGRALTQEHNLASLFSIIVADLGRLYALSGRVAEAVHLHEMGADKSGSMNLMATHPRNLALLGEAYGLAGRPDDAARTTQRALDLSRVHGQRGLEADAWRILGDISANRQPPDVERAERSYGEALALAEELRMRPLIAGCHLGIGMLYQQTGDRARAGHHLAAAMALFQEMDARFWLAKAASKMKRDQVRSLEAGAAQPEHPATQVGPARVG